MSAEHTQESARIDVFGWTDTAIEFRRCSSLTEATDLVAAHRFVWIDVEGVGTADCAHHLERVAEARA